MASVASAMPSALANSMGWLFSGDGSKFGRAILIKKDGSAMLIEKAAPTPNRVQGGTAKQDHSISKPVVGVVSTRPKPSYRAGTQCAANRRINPREGLIQHARHGRQLCRAPCKPGKPARMLDGFALLRRGVPIFCPPIERRPISHSEDGLDKKSDEVN